MENKNERIFDGTLNVTGSPHINDKVTTRSLMLDVIIALIPASIWGVLRFGLYSLLVMIVSILAAVASETIFNNIMKKENTISDLSAVVTGLILALNMPPVIPLYIPIIGAAFAIIVVKMLFGGLGQNFMNPALAGRCFLLISFANQMNDFNSKVMSSFNARWMVDAVSTATPLKLINIGIEPNLIDMFLGYIPGAIGEVSTLCLLIGAIYLIVRKVISIRIPFVFIGSFIIFLMLFSGNFDYKYLFAEVLGGGLVFSAFYMATDYATSPVTRMGQIVYAVILGLLTAIFRIYGKTPENLSYCILVGNLLVPIIENFTIPRPFGREGE